MKDKNSYESSSIALYHDLFGAGISEEIRKFMRDFSRITLAIVVSFFIIGCFIKLNVFYFNNTIEVFLNKVPRISMNLGRIKQYVEYDRYLFILNIYKFLIISWLFLILYSFYQLFILIKRYYDKVSKVPSYTNFIRKNLTFIFSFFVFLFFPIHYFFFSSHDWMKLRPNDHKLFYPNGSILIFDYVVTFSFFLLFYFLISILILQTCALVFKHRNHQGDL